VALRTNSSGLTYWVTKPNHRAECMDCGEEFHQSTALALAANHHRKTGHTVFVTEERSIVYETRERHGQG
jgi:hypothetical protein